MAREFLLPGVAAMEQALANALSAANSSLDPGAIQRILKLVIKKEILLELLLEEIPPQPEPLPECPCSITGNRGTGQSPDADAVITVNGGTPTNAAAAYNIVLCNVPCNPNVNNLVFNFRVARTPGNPAQVFNFTQGRATEIVACNPDLGTATVVGTIRQGNDVYDFTLTITNNASTITFTAVNQEDPTDTFNAVITDAEGGPVAEIEDCPNQS